MESNYPKIFRTRFRDLLYSPNYQAVFPGAEVDAGGASLAEVRMSAKGYRLATTVQGPATGKGAHCIIVDDPFKASEASSESVRNSVYDWFKGSLMTRFDKPAEGAMIVVQQRLHQDDLIGRLRDEGGWDYLDMPGECVEQKAFGTTGKNDVRTELIMFIRPTIIRDGADAAMVAEELRSKMRSGRSQALTLPSMLNVLSRPAQ